MTAALNRAAEPTPVNTLCACDHQYLILFIALRGRWSSQKFTTTRLYTATSDRRIAEIVPSRR